MNDVYALVVFTNQTDLPWLRFLKKGFRHCFVVINNGKNWVSIDPMANYMDIAIHDVSPDFDLLKFLCSQGHIVVQTHINKYRKTPAPWMFFTCVEACKRVLGIHKRFVFTPWQLYCHIHNSNQKEIKNGKSNINTKSATKTSSGCTSGSSYG